MFNLKLNFSKLINYISNKIYENLKINHIEKKLNRFELFRLDIIQNSRKIKKLESVIQSQQEIIEQLDFIVFDLCKRLDDLQPDKPPVLDTTTQRRILPDSACKRTRLE